MSRSSVLGFFFFFAVLPLFPRYNLVGARVGSSAVLAGAGRELQKMPV